MENTSGEFTLKTSADGLLIALPILLSQGCSFACFHTVAASDRRDRCHTGSLLQCGGQISTKGRVSLKFQHNLYVYVKCCQVASDYK